MLQVRTYKDIIRVDIYAVEQFALRRSGYYFTQMNEQLCVKKLLSRGEERNFSGIVLKHERVCYFHMFEFTVFSNTWYAFISHWSGMVSITSREVK